MSERLCVFVHPLLLLAGLLGASQPAFAQAAPVPVGRLPDSAIPAAYRLKLDIDPRAARFSGHVEIDVDVARPTAVIYLNGRNLHVTQSAVRSSGRTLPARYEEVDSSGVVRLTLGRPAGGRITLLFDYDAPFNDAATGLYRVKVGQDWYSWSQFETVEARSAFPCFDQPGFKTPFAITVTTATGDLAIGNSAELPAAPGRVTGVHRFAPTPPLPTYLVVLAVGPFAAHVQSIPANAIRSAPLPLGTFATWPHRGQGGFLEAETPHLVDLLETYLGTPFPYAKLDQIGSPTFVGAMENAAGIIYGDPIIFFAGQPTPFREEEFGRIVTHEIAHQWFGDFVTPKWWDDAWLNESFANWLGYRTAGLWRPNLDFATRITDEATRAMAIDALLVGRPVHQPIATALQATDAFDAVTYGKGAQIIGMFANFVGEDRFRDGVRLYLGRHANGNADSDDFFTALGEALHDPRIAPAMRGFVDQEGVPLLSFRRDGNDWIVRQQRYASLGTPTRETLWAIPACLRAGAQRDCILLDKTETRIPAVPGTLMPNADGRGYYRFELDQPSWQVLIDTLGHVSGPEGVAIEDSLWASFAAGHANPAQLLQAARQIAVNGNTLASLDPGHRLALWNMQGLIEPRAQMAYRALLLQLYADRLASLGLDPGVGVYVAEPVSRQEMRQQLVELMAWEARDPDILAQLQRAGRSYLAGDASALDPTYLVAGLTAVVALDDQGSAWENLLSRALASDDASFRGGAFTALGRGIGGKDLPALLQRMNGPTTRSSDRLALIGALLGRRETRTAALQLTGPRFGDFLIATGGVAVDRVLGPLGLGCDLQDTRSIEEVVLPAIEKFGRGKLGLERAMERVRNCTLLRRDRQAQITSALQHNEIWLNRKGIPKSSEN